MDGLSIQYIGGSDSHKEKPISQRLVPYVAGVLRDVNRMKELFKLFNGPLRLNEVCSMRYSICSNSRHVNILFICAD
jgi:hypothetical protein